MAKVDLPHVINNFHPKTDLVLDKKTFIFTMAHSSNLLFGDLLNIMYELLRDCFFLDDSINDFDIIFEICEHIVHGHFLPSISCLFVALRLLALKKQIKNIRTIRIK